MIDSLLQLFQSTATATDATEVLLNLALGVVMSVVLSWHYVRFSKTYANRRELAQVRRLDVREGLVQATYDVDCGDNTSLVALMDDLHRRLPDAHISFVEQRGIPGL